MQPLAEWLRPSSPSGYPRPSHRSWCPRTTGSVHIQPGNHLHDLPAADHVRLHRGEFVVRQPPRLAEDVVVDGDFADVVQQRRDLELLPVVASLIPSSSANNNAYAVTRCVWLPVYGSRISMACASEVIVWSNSDFVPAHQFAPVQTERNRGGECVGQCQVVFGERCVLGAAVEVQHAERAVAARGGPHTPPNSSRRSRRFPTGTCSASARSRNSSDCCRRKASVASVLPGARIGRDAGPDRVAVRGELPRCFAEQKDSAASRAELVDHGAQ